MSNASLDYGLYQRTANDAKPLQVVAPPQVGDKHKGFRMTSMRIKTLPGWKRVSTMSTASSTPPRGSSADHGKSPV
ncbi:hypothetical protein FJTKL_10669 [Diaporthe vaccinii]|uniref:Uncharacterized protein n=1 Tax=Diaporthe vaccinii TaxID=105482 RepID=A0ABR4FB96_9PEZI